MTNTTDTVSPLRLLWTGRHDHVNHHVGGEFQTITGAPTVGAPAGPAIYNPAVVLYISTATGWLRFGSRPSGAVNAG
jgi:hypothetical protein